MLNLPTIYNLGDHAYKILHEDGGRATHDKLGKGSILLHYAVNHRKGGAWVTSKMRWPCTLDGVRDALDYAQHLLRLQDRGND